MIGTDSWPAPEAVPPSPAVDTPPPGHTSHDILTQALVSIRAGCSGRVGTVHSWYACLERCTVTSTVTEDESSVKVQCDEQRRYHIIRLQLQVQGSSLLRYAAVLHVSNCVNVQVYLESKSSASQDYIIKRSIWCNEYLRSTEMWWGQPTVSCSHFARVTPAWMTCFTIPRWAQCIAVQRVTATNACGRSGTDERSNTTVPREHVELRGNV